MTTILSGAQAALSAFNKARHAKLPISVFKPFSVGPTLTVSALGGSNTATAIPLPEPSLIDKLGLAMERHIEKKLGLIDTTPTPQSPAAGDGNVFPLGEQAPMLLWVASDVC